MPRNYNEREYVAVEIKPGGTTLQYAFKSGLKAAGDRTALGQIELNTITSVTGLIIGCNNPKPAKATKKNSTTSNNVTTFTGGSKSSFCGSDAYELAKSEGWTITNPKDLRNPVGAKYILINGVKYGWISPAMPTGVAAPAEDTGTKVGTANDVLCFGCSFPKPPRMKKVLTGGNTYSTFVEPAKVDTLAAAGWDKSKGGKITTSLIGATPTPTPTPE